MTMTETPRVAELAARFNALKLAEDQALRSGAAERRAIVAELIDQFQFDPDDVAKLLSISRTRVYEIRRGGRR